MSDQTAPLFIQPTLPATMKIASADTEFGYVIINVADFDAATMTPYEEPAAEEAPAPSKRQRTAEKAE